MIVVHLLAAAILYMQMCTILSSSVYNGENWISLDDSEQPPLGQVELTNSDIFVNLIHYRDSRCARTLYNLFQKAKNPERVFVGLAQYRFHQDADCIAEFCKIQGKSVDSKCPHISQIRNVVMSQFEYKSMSRSRHVASTLMNNEEFCMSIETDSNFIHNWDEEVISTWSQTRNEYGILSTIPPVGAISDVVQYHESSHEVPHICSIDYYRDTSPASGISYSLADGLIEALPSRPARDLKRPVLSSAYSSSFAFSKCHSERKVPWDPYYENIHKGLDFVKYARLWTRGYDVYTPHRIIISHENTHADPVGAKEAPEMHDPIGYMKNGMNLPVRIQHKDDAVRRLATILGSKKVFWNAASGAFDKVDADDLLKLTKYGLGFKRTLDAFIEFTGVDTREQIVFGDRCIALTHVQFKVDTDPATDESDVWGMSPEVMLYSSEGAQSLPYSASTADPATRSLLFGNIVPLLNSGVKARLSLAAITDGTRVTAEVLTSNQHMGEASTAQTSSMMSVWHSLFWWMDSLVAGVMYLFNQTFLMGIFSPIVMLKIFLVIFPFCICCMVICLRCSAGERLSDLKAAPCISLADSELWMKMNRRVASSSLLGGITVEDRADDDDFSPFPLEQLDLDEDITDDAEV